MWPMTANFQSILSQSTANSTAYTPHHPITCVGERLYLTTDGSFGCEHAEVPPDDERTMACLNHSVAFLLFEMLVERWRGT